jgi:nitronate monooxygenase
MELHQSLGVELPVIQAPMAGSQGSALAIAVCGAGGLGSLPCAMLDAQAIRREIAAIRAAGIPGAFNLNFFCHRPPVADAAREATWRSALEPYYREFGLDLAAVPAGAGRIPFDATSAALVEKLRPRVVSFISGRPTSPCPTRARERRAHPRQARRRSTRRSGFEERGVDAVIAQGLEAGGHRGHFLSDDLGLQAGTFALPQVVRALRIPVIAAGGIADRAGSRPRFGSGFDGPGGHRIPLPPRAPTTAIHRRALTSAATRHTALTRLDLGARRAPSSIA